MAKVNESITNVPVGTLMLYGCGGAGINIATHFANVQSEQGSAKIVSSFIDTSRSNLKKNLDPQSIYVVPDLDGSGKIRSENHLEIANVIKDILVKHKPADFNVVLFSLSGGSGSVIGPLLISELLERGLPVVALVVGSDESVLTANNTLKSLKSLEAIALKNNKPVVIAYGHNERGGKRSDVDTRMQSFVGALAYLCSRQNAELDSQDIANWVDFTRTTNLSPQLALLEIHDKGVDVDANFPNPASVASLFGDRDEVGLMVVPDYHCAGYTDLSKAGVSNLHFVIDIDSVPMLSNRINTTLKNQREVAEARPTKSGVLTRDDVVEGNGLIL